MRPSVANRFVVPSWLDQAPRSWRVRIEACGELSVADRTHAQVALALDGSIVHDDIVVITSVRPAPSEGRRAVDLVSQLFGNSGLDRSWQARANCMGVDPDLFFPERGASTREAKEVCRGCVVREDCLEYAIANGEKFGIWGGLSERERRKIRRARQLARAATPAS
jgi:WhiB family redox-sensing transcriptional regulator